jgi:hypothetical protein
MSTFEDDRDLEDRVGPAVIVLRIIVVALACGVLGFAAVAVVTRVNRVQPQPPAQPQQAGGGLELLTMMALVAAPIATVLSLLVPAVMVKNIRRQIADGTYGTYPGQTAASRQGVAGLPEDMASYVGLYQTKTIVGIALLEGAAFLAIVAFMLEGNWIALALGICLAAMILFSFPSAPRVANWIRQQQRIATDDEKLRR